MVDEKKFAKTPGTWTVGEGGGTVVSDHPNPDLHPQGRSDAFALEYYGGHLIAESIGSQEDARLMAAAPDLLEAVKAAQLSLRHSAACETTIERGEWRCTCSFMRVFVLCLDAITKATGGAA